MCGKSVCTRICACVCVCLNLFQQIIWILCLVYVHLHIYCTYAQVCCMKWRGWTLISCGQDLTWPSSSYFLWPPLPPLWGFNTQTDRDLLLSGTSVDSLDSRRSEAAYWDVPVLRCNSGVSGIDWKFEAKHWKKKKKKFEVLIFFWGKVGWGGLSKVRSFQTLSGKVDELLKVHSKHQDPPPTPGGQMGQLTDDFCHFWKQFSSDLHINT